MIYLELFWGFLKVGIFMFGGAYGAIPLIRDIVLSYGWVNDDMFSYMIAVSESTPGPMMVNLATYVGSTQAGFFGALISTFAVVLPAFLVILLILIILKNILKNKYVQAILGGLKPCIVGIVLATGAYMVIRNLFAGTSASMQDAAFYVPDFKSIAFTAGLAAIFYGSRIVLKKKMSPILLIVISAAAGILVF